jgi:hypothetical protein
MPQQRRGMETRKGNWGEGGMNVIKVIKYMNESVITKPIIFNILIKTEKGKNIKKLYSQSLGLQEVPGTVLCSSLCSHAFLSGQGVEEGE